MTTAAKTSTHVPSTRALFYALDQKTTSREKVLEKLDAATPFLQQGLKAYGPNNATSRAEIESGSIDLAGKKIAVGADMQKCTVTLAQLLKLDEIQTYVMLRRALEEKGITARPKELTGELIELVCTFYQRERLALLKCIAVLGTQKAYVFNGENEDGFSLESEKEQAENEFALRLSEKLDEMIRNGLEDNIVNYLCDSLLANGEGLGSLASGIGREERSTALTVQNPTSTALATTGSNEDKNLENKLIRAQGEEFVRLSSCIESVEEIKASLDVLFSLYYGVVKECSSTRFLQLAKTFDQKVFSKIPHKCTEVINLAPSMAEQMEFIAACDIRARCAIILIVAIDLERIVHTFSSGQGSGEAQHHLLSAVVQVTTVLSQTTDTVESGAVKLSWAAFLSLAKSTITGISQSDELSMTAFLSAMDVANGLDSLKILATNTKSSFDGSDPSAIPRRSVLKNVLSATLAGFDILPVHALLPNQLDLILECFDEIICGQRELCEQFWEGANENGQEAPLLALVEGCRERFPAEAAPLLRVLKSLSEGPKAAECALSYLTKLPAVALPYPDRDVAEVAIKQASNKSRVDRSSGKIFGHVVCATPIASSKVPGACIPSNCRGVAIPSSSSSGTNLIVWSEPADGLYITLSRIGNLSSVARRRREHITPEDRLELHAALSFIAVALENAPSFAAPLLKCDLHASASEIGGTPSDVLSALALSLRVEKSDDYSIQAMALAALRPLAAAAPRRAADVVLNTPFFTEDDKASSTNGVTASQCLQFEESRGVHDSIKALCALSETFLLAGECGDESQLLFQRSALYALLRFDSWRYLERSEKWVVHKCASRALQAALLTSKFEYFEKMCMVDDDATVENGNERSSQSPKQTFSIRTCVFLMNDEQTLAGALAPLRFDAHFLQRVYESGSECRAKEVVALEDAIASVLRVIPALSSVFEHNSEITGGTFSRSIAKALFIQAPPPERGPPMVQAIASYASYPYASECCRLAIPALIPLCTTAPASAPLSAAFSGIEADETCRQLRDRIKLALKDIDVDPEATSHAISLLASASANQPPFADAIIYGPDYAQIMIGVRDSASSDDDESKKDDGTKNTEDIKDNTANALADKQPTSVALVAPATKSSETQYPKFDELWLALDKILEIEDVSYGATFAFALNIFWKSRVALPNPVDGLASEPRVFQKLASIVERANEVCSESSNHDDVVHANAFSALSSSLGILASESLVALTVSANRSEHLREAMHTFLSRDEGLLRSVMLSLSSAEEKANLAWMKMDIFILGLRAVMLSAAAELATAQAGGDSACFASATLEYGAEFLARSLLEQPVAREVLSREGQKAAARLLTDVAHAATATFETVFADNSAFLGDIKHASSRVNVLLQHAITSNCENFIFVDAPVGLGGGSVYGDSYVYDSEWIERACGVFNTDDGKWGAPETRLASLARKVAACSREVSIIASLCDAKITAIENLSAFLKASGSLETLQNIVGPELDALDAEYLQALEERKEHVKQNLLAPKFANVGITALAARNDGIKGRARNEENENNQQNTRGFSLIQPSILEKWSHHSRRETVNMVALELIHAVQKRRSESPRQVSLIVALCELLEISARLWTCSRKKFPANQNDSANKDYEALKNVARAACALLASKICPHSHIACVHACAAFERSLSCWSKEANAVDAAKAIDIGNVASQAIPHVRALAVSKAVPAASSVCALRLLTKLFGNDGAFASPSMLILGSDDDSSAAFIPDMTGAFASGDNISLASLRVSFKSAEKIEVDCTPSEFDELARLTSSDIVFSALHACLEFAKTSEGAYVLMRTGAYNRVCELASDLLDECASMVDAPVDEADVLKLSALSLSIQVSTELARSFQNSDIDSSITTKLASFACLAERFILSAMKPSSITLSNLRKTKVCCALLAAVSSDERLKFGWQLQSPNGQASLRDEAALFLRWFAAPPVHSGATSHNCCLPQNAAEEARAHKPSETGLSSCWFGVLNRGSRVLTSLRTQSSALSPMALSPAAAAGTSGTSPLMLGSAPSTTPLGTKNSVLFTSSNNGNVNTPAKTPTTPTLISNQGGQALGTPLGRKRFTDAKSPKTPDGGILKSPSPIHSLNAGTANERTNLHSEVLAAELHDIAMHCAQFLSSFREKNIAPEVVSAIVDQCDVLLEELQANSASKTKAGTKIEESLVGIKRSIAKSA